MSTNALVVVTNSTLLVREAVVWQINEHCFRHLLHGEQRYRLSFLDKYAPDHVASNCPCILSSVASALLASHMSRAASALHSHKHCHGDWDVWAGDREPASH